MSSPADFYHSLPPISRAYGSICLATTVAYHLGILNPYFIIFNYDLVFKRFQIWRVLTNFFFLGPFSMAFGMRLLMIARYGVQLEKSVYSQRAADFLWMMICAMLTMVGVAALIPPLRFPIMGPSIVFMLLYLWSREFATSRVNVAGLVTLLGFYLPWAMLVLNMIFGSSPMPDLMGIVIGHLYYFITVLHPRSGGRNLIVTPLWVHKLANKLNLLHRPNQSSVSTAAGRPSVADTPPRRTAFTGQSYRLNRD